MGWLPTGLLPEVRSGFDLDYERASLILTAHLMGGYFGSAVGGVLADVSDRRRLLVAGTAVYALGLGLASCASSLPAMLLACALIGLASGPVVHTAQLILADRARASGERLERFLGRFNALGSVGDLIGPASLVAGLGFGLGWRSLFGLAALVVASYGLGVAGTAAKVPAPVAFEGPESRPGWRAILEAVRDRRLLRLAVALALLDALDEPFAGFVLLYLRDVVGWSAAAGNAALGVLVGSTLGGFALAAHLDWTRGRFMRICLWLMGGALAAFPLVPGVSLKLVCLGLVGLSTAGFYTAALAEVLDLRPGLAGTATSVLSVVGALSLAFPPIAGALADHAGLRSSLLLYAALPFVMLILVRGVRTDSRR